MPRNWLNPSGIDAGRPIIPASNTKYRNRKTTLAGITFDSRHEAERYLELCLLQRAGKICDLQLQVPFELIPRQTDKDGKLLEREVTYTADFVYTDIYHGMVQVVEDAKGMRTKDYVIRRKLMLWRHGIRVQEV